MSNTNSIVAAQGAGSYAAQLCADLVLNTYDDWYLPSKDELNKLYLNIGQGAPSPNTNIGGFASVFYWSSSEYNSLSAWFLAFNLGLQTGAGRSGTFHARAVRAF